MPSPLTLCMITKQAMEQRKDEIILCNHIDFSREAQAAYEARKLGNNGWSKSKTMKCVAHIPLELSATHPYLVAATEARQWGNNTEAKMWLKRFLIEHPEFKVSNF